jgi:hypothetical protein
LDAAKHGTLVATMTTAPDKHPAFVRSRKASRRQSSKCGSTSRIFLNSKRGVARKL